MTITEFFASLNHGTSEKMMGEICLVVRMIAKHQGRQFRDSGEPYLDHCFDVMHQLMEIGLPNDVILAGGLHDLIEDTEVEEGWLRVFFSDRTVRLVAAVSKKPKSDFVNKEARLKEYHERFETEAVQDFAVIFIKSADRLHNLATLHGLSGDPKKQQRVALETLDFYVPYLKKEAPMLVPEKFHAYLKTMAHRMEHLAKAYIIIE